MPTITENTSVKLNNLVDVLHERGHLQSERQAYSFLDFASDSQRQINYQQLDQQARALAATMQARISHGDRVILLYPPGLEFVTAFFGCLYSGAVAVPAYPPRRNQNLKRLQSIIGNAKPTMLLTTSDLLERESWQTEPSLAHLQWLVTDQIDPDRAVNWQRPALQAEDLAFLQYTSGSTGQPKGVMISHGNLMHNSQLIHSYFGHSPSSRGVIWLPVYHDMGLIGGVIQPLYGGFPVALMSALDFLQKPLRWLQAISDQRATTSGAPNFAYDLCVQKVRVDQLAELDLSCWNLAFTGAEPVRPETLQNFSNKFAGCGFRAEAFYPCYGMAETTLIVTGGQRQSWPKMLPLNSIALEQHRVEPAHLDSPSRTLVSCGACIGQKIAIVDPQSLESLGSDQVGEIWVMGASVAHGYWQQSALTAYGFCSYIEDSSGPYLRTGDLGFISDGELYITGRIKDVIIVHGQNHYPQDIELTVERSHPALRPWGGAAFALDHGGQGRPIVVHEVERSYLRQLPAAEIIDSIRQAVVAEHGLVLGAVVLLKTSTIPKTSSGKIQRFACREGFLQGNLQVVADWAADPQICTGFIRLQSDLSQVLQQIQKPVQGL